MADMWGRFVWWTAQNAVVVQALVALIMAFATVVLVLVTACYAALTNGILNSSRQQLAAMLQPNPIMTITALTGRSANDNTPAVFIRYSVSNEGEGPIRIEVLEFRRDGQVFELPQYKGIILSPKKKIPFSGVELLTPFIAPQGVTDGTCIDGVEISVVCSDINQQFVHCFTTDGELKRHQPVIKKKHFYSR